MCGKCSSFVIFSLLLVLTVLLLYFLRPPIFVSIFKIGGAITVLGQHLVNIKCMFPDMSDGEVFFLIQTMWSVAPFVLLLLCLFTWYLLSKCKTVNDLEIKIKTSCVALLYLVWPSLCSQTFSIFACRSICDDTTTFFRADLDVSCWKGVHAHYAFLLGLPMLFLYVIELPVAALLRVRSMHNKAKILVSVINEHDEKIYGMFYTAFRKEKWWWEGTIAARKIIIALIGVFGADMGDMQVHLTAMLVFLIILVTSQVRPFGGLNHGVLHVLEMASLMVSVYVVSFDFCVPFLNLLLVVMLHQATFLTLWAGSVFNARPRCEDPLKGEGSTLVWCDALSITVGLVDIVVLAAIGVCFVYIKVESISIEAKNDGDGSSFADILSNANDSLQRWRFSRMTSEAQQRVIRRRTIDADDGNTAINPVTIEMADISNGESAGEIKVDDDELESIGAIKQNGTMYENPTRKNKKLCV